MYSRRKEAHRVYHEFCTFSAAFELSARQVVKAVFLVRVDRKWKGIAKY
jgi:hypothetical protein